MEVFVYNDSDIQMNSKLILCIEEHDDIKKTKSVDTRLFIGWSNLDNDFFIRGKRVDIGTKEFVPYAFHCNSIDKLYDFIEFVIGSKSNTSIILYNYNNIDVNSREQHVQNNDELTYDFFEKYMDKNYEITAYDKVRLDRVQIKKYLNLLKYIYNWEY